MRKVLTKVDIAMGDGGIVPFLNNSVDIARDHAEMVSNYESVWGFRVWLAWRMTWYGLRLTRWLFLSIIPTHL